MRATFVGATLRFRGSGEVGERKRKHSVFLSLIFISPALERVVTLHSQYAPNEAAADLTDAYTCISATWQKLTTTLYPRI